MNWLVLLLGIVLFAIWVLTYVYYRLMLLSAIVIHSAREMKTGNDLGEQIEKTIKQKSPNYFQFYWNTYKRCQKN